MKNASVLCLYGLRLGTAADHACCWKMGLESFKIRMFVILAIFFVQTHARMHTHTQPFYISLDFVWDYMVEPVPEETFTHSHLSFSLIVLYLLPPSAAIHGILPVQFTCLTVFLHNLCPSVLWSGTLHLILHTFLHPIIVFFSLCIHGFNSHQ